MSSSGSTNNLAQLLQSNPKFEKADVIAFDDLVKQKLVPEDLPFQPAICLKKDGAAVLVHVLAAGQVPEYVKKAVTHLKSAGSTAYILIVAQQVMTERTDAASSFQIPAPYVAAAIAEDARKLGCALAFEWDKRIHLVFDKEYSVPICEACDEETGHVPKWILASLANHASFSPYLRATFKAFEGEYRRATRRHGINNERETDLLFKFAKRVARGDKRLFYPLGQLEVLRQYELSKANKKTRDHFFHTFNNLFLGFYILAGLVNGRRFIADIDRSVADDKKKAKVYPWEVLWFLTCMFHDPAYIAEKFWGTFRFSYGIVDEVGDDEDIPEQVKDKIKNMWETAFAAPRKDLHDLHERTAKKWVPASLRKKSLKNTFDLAVEQAYFDGRTSSHSLVSGLRLVNGYYSQLDVPRPKSYRKDVALAGCVIAGLCMMFHDQRCRSILEAAGIQPIAFEHLPYASLLMYVDSLQDDRRDISRSRFKEKGVLRSISVSGDQKEVKAVVCLPEVDIKGWPGRIAEYESVTRWINQSSDVRFIIEYRGLAKLQ